MAENPDDIDPDESDDDGGQLVASLESKARRLVELRDARDVDKETAKNSEKAYRAYEQEFFQAVADSPIKGALKLDLGGGVGEVSFSLRETTYGRVLDAEKAAEYFKARSMDAAMFEPKISGQRLNEHIRELLDNGTPPPEGLDFFVNRGVTISRQK
jgi:hypothetical protein